MGRLVTYFETQKPMLLNELSASANSCEKARLTAEAYLDRILIRYNEQAKDDSLRKAASMMMGILKMALPLIDCLKDDTEKHFSGYPRQSSHTPAGRDKKGAGWGKILTGAMLVTGAVLILAALMRFMAGDRSDSGIVWIFLSLLAAAAGTALVWFSGHRAGKTIPAGAGPAYGPGISGQGTVLDAGRMCRILKSVLTLMDQELEKLENSRYLDKGSARDASEPGGIPDAADSGQGDILLSKQGMELIANLLEALYSRDGQFAIERLEDVRYFLHQNGYALCEPEEGNLAFFDLMPGKQTRLVRPALVRDGRLVKKGLMVSGNAAQG